MRRDDISNSKDCMDVAVLNSKTLRPWTLVKVLENMRKMVNDIRRRERHYRGIHENALEGIARFSPRGEALSANPAFARMLGYEHSEELVRSITDFGRQCWLDPHEWDSLVRALRTQGAASGCEVELVRADGSHIWVFLSARAVRSETGDMLFLEANVSGVAGEKHREAALWESELCFRGVARDMAVGGNTEGERRTSLLTRCDPKKREDSLESALQMAHVGYWDRELDTDRVTWSDETCRIMGTAQRLSNRSFADELAAIHPEDRPCVTRAVLIALDGGARFDVEFRVLRPDGDVRIVRKQGDLVTDKSGHPRRMFGTIQDITKHKRAEERLAESEQRVRAMPMALAHANRLATVGQFTAELAHEIKQPIAAAATHAAAAVRWLRTQPPNLDEAQRALSYIVDDTRRTCDVIVRIRRLVTKTPMSEGFLRVNDAIMEVMNLISGEVEKNAVSARAQLAESLPLIHGDRVQLQQVMLNLSINAIEAMSSCGGPRELSIETGTDAQGNVLVAVRDSGPGLGPDALKQIFEPFYTTKPAGMGIGLSICRSIVEAHGGRLWVSDNPAGGSIFQFSIPSETSCGSRDSS